MESATIIFRLLVGVGGFFAAVFMASLLGLRFMRWEAKPPMPVRFILLLLCLGIVVCSILTVTNSWR